jgi:hypothetical protein
MASPYGLPERETTTPVSSAAALGLVPVTLPPPLTTSATPWPVVSASQPLLPSSSSSPPFDHEQFAGQILNFTRHVVENTTPENDPALYYTLWAMIGCVALLVLIASCAAFKCYCTYGVGPFRLTCAPHAAHLDSLELGEAAGQRAYTRGATLSPAPSSISPDASTVAAAAAAAAAAAVCAFTRANPPLPASDSERGRNASV